MLKSTEASAGSVDMTDFMVAFLIGLSFITGFWVGVDWYRKKIIQEELDAQEARTE
jgi:hypothetical protein